MYNNRTLNPALRNMYPTSKVYNFFRYMDDTIFFIAVVFSIIGLVVWWYGGKKGSHRIQWMAAVMIFFGYFMPTHQISLSVGSLLLLLALWPVRASKP